MISRSIWRLSVCGTLAATLALGGCATDGDGGAASDIQGAGDVDSGGGGADSDAAGGLGDTGGTSDTGMGGDTSTVSDTGPGGDDAGTVDAGMTDAGANDVALDDAGSDDVAMDDAGTGDAGQEDAADVQAPQMASGHFVLEDYLSGAALQGAVITMGDQSVTTDADGAATISVPIWAPHHIIGTLEGYHDVHWYGYNDDGDFSRTQRTVSKAASATLSGALGIPLDPAKGFVYVSVKKKSALDSSLGALAGATVDLDVPYDVALTSDAASPLGLSPGNTTLEGSEAWVIFVNVAAGPVHATVTAPESYDCTVFPGEEPSMEIDAHADGMSILTMMCESPTAQGGFTLIDYLSNAPLPGAALSLGDQTLTTDAEGKAELTFDTWAPYHVSSTLDGYHDSHWYGFNDGEGFSGTYPMVSHSTTAMLAGALGITIDPEKGFLMIGVGEVASGSNKLGSLAGATVDLDVPYDAALVPDVASPFGISPGKTTLEGSAASVIFVNVPAGPVNVTVTPPGGYACTVFPGNMEAQTITTFADSFSRQTYTCMAP